VTPTLPDGPGLDAAAHPNPLDDLVLEDQLLPGRRPRSDVDETGLEGRLIDPD